MQLNFPPYQFRFKNKNNQRYIFDSIRKKYYILTPEEWVRQHVIQYLIHEKGYPKGRIGVEKVVKINGMSKRADIIVYAKNGDIFLVVECKNIHIKITQDTFDQLARYHQVLRAKYLMITNGLTHYYCQIDDKEGCYQFLPTLPDGKIIE